MRDGGGGATGALIDFDQGLSFCVEGQVDLLGDHDCVGFWEIVEFGGVDESQEDVLLAGHAEFVLCWEGFSWLTVGNYHLVLGNVLGEFQLR